MENKDKFNQITKLTKEETERLFSEAVQDDKEKGEAYLLHSDGTVEINRGGYDYTKWRREYFDKMKPGEFSEEAVAYAKAHPHKGKGQRL